MLRDKSLQPEPDARTTILTEEAGFVGSVPVVVLVEDDKEFSAELSDYLCAHGLAVECIASLEELIAQYRARAPDLLVIDQFIGKFDSLAFLPGLRKDFDGGIVILTGNQDQVDRIVALEAGADDFIVKSLGPRELLARLRAVLRRINTGDGTPARRTMSVPVFNEWRLNVRRLEVRAPDGSYHKLTHAEFETLRLLALSAGEPVTRDIISAHVLRRAFSPLDRSVDNLVSRIRKVLDPYCADFSSIVAVRGQGYALRAFDKSNTVLEEDTEVRYAVVS